MSKIKLYRNNCIKIDKRRFRGKIVKVNHSKIYYSIILPSKKNTFNHLSLPSPLNVSNFTFAITLETIEEEGKKNRWKIQRLHTLFISFSVKRSSDLRMERGSLSFLKRTDASVIPPITSTDLKSLRCHTGLMPRARRRDVSRDSEGAI